MKDFLASVYEYFVWHNVYSVDLFNNNIYFLLILCFLIPPCITFGIFYFLVKYPFCRWWHWALILILNLLLTGVTSYNLLTTNLIQYVLDDGSYPDIDTFIYNIILFNLIYGFIFSFIISSIYKLFPLPQRNIPWVSKK